MKKLFLFLTLACAAVAQVKIDIGDVDWPSQSASQLFRRNAANNGFEFFTASPVITLGTDATGNVTLTNLGNGTLNLTLAAVNSNTGSWGSATQAPVIILDGKGRATAASNVTITPAWSSITGKPTAVDGSTTQVANTVFAGPTSGSNAVPAFRVLGQADTQAATAANRNALAPRGGLAFDGTAGARIYSALGTAGALGTDPFSVVVGFKCPTISGPGILTISNSSSAYSGAGTLVFMVNGTNLLVQIGPDTDRNYATLANFTTTWGGKDIEVAFVRNATGNPTLYVNGVAQTLTFFTAGTPPTWQGSVSATYLVTGTAFSSAEMRDPIRFVSIYNLALTAGDVQEIFELGGGVPERFKFGSQAELIAATADRDMSGANNWQYVSAGGSVSGGVLNYSGSADQQRVMLLPVNFGLWAGKGKYYRFKADIGSYSVTGGAALQLRLGVTNITLGTITGNGTIDIAFAPDDATNSQNIGLWQNGSGTAAATMDNVSIRRAGAVVHLALDDGVGLQLTDASTNKLHAISTTTGVSHVIPKSRGVVRFTTSTNGNQQILGQQALPANARITAWAINSSGTPTVSLGNASAGAQFVSGAVLASGLNDVTLLTRYCSTNNLWVNSNSTATLQHTIYYEIVD